MHNGEYTIDPRANEISYGKSNLALELRNALTAYEDSKAFSSGTGFPTHSTRAFTMITAAFSHGVVIQRSSVQRQLRDAENRLEHCERDNRDLQKNNKDLLAELKREGELRKHFQQRLEKYEPSSDGDVSHG